MLDDLVLAAAVHRARVKEDGIAGTEQGHGALAISEHRISARDRHLAARAASAKGGVGLRRVRARQEECRAHRRVDRLQRHEAGGN